MVKAKSRCLGGVVGACVLAVAVVAAVLSGSTQSVADTATVDVIQVAPRSADSPGLTLELRPESIEVRLHSVPADAEVHQIRHKPLGTQTWAWSRSRTGTWTVDGLSPDITVIVEVRSSIDGRWGAFTRAVVTTPVPGSILVYTATARADDGPSLRLVARPGTVTVTVTEEPAQATNHQLRQKRRGETEWTWEGQRTSGQWTIGGIDSDADMIVEVRSFVGGRWGSFTRRAIRPPPMVPPTTVPPTTIPPTTIPPTTVPPTTVPPTTTPPPTTEAPEVLDGLLRNVAFGLCVDVPNAAKDLGLVVRQAVCDGDPNQQITLDPVGGDWYEIRFGHANRCLHVQDFSRDEEAALVQWWCGGGENSHWRAESVGNGVRLVVRHSRLCLGVAAGGIGVGAATVQTPCDDLARTTVVGVSPTFAGDPQRGEWSDPVQFPLVPVAMANLPDGRVLTWSASDRFDYRVGRGVTYTAIFDPETNTVSEQTVDETGHDMFCPAITNLPDGRILVAGGRDDRRASIFDANTDTWINAPDMNIGRGYQTGVVLADGTTFNLGGSWSGGEGGKFGEIFDGESWRTLTGVRPEDGFLTSDNDGVFRADNHMWLFTWGDRVFHAGPSPRMHWVDVAGRGTVTYAGRRGSDLDAMNGTAVMYAPGRILTVGGSENYDNGPGRTTAHVIDIADGSAEVRRVEDMTHARTLHSSVVLPSGNVVIIGGQEEARLFTDRRAVLDVEIFDPETETWTLGAPMEIPRTYHSAAVLLHDGRILVGGGGLCGSCSYNHPDAEIYSPPYLFEADGRAAVRPELSGVPSTADHGGLMTVTAPDATEFVLMRSSNATHTVNVEQRRVPLDVVGRTGSTVSLRLPADGGIAPPGVYVLFAMSSTGVPSVGEPLVLG